MKIRFYASVIALVLTAPLVADAGVNVTGTGATPELACWDYERKANRVADTNNTWYMSCNPSQPTLSGGQYTVTISVPNHGGRRKSKYNRTPMSDAAFLSTYPKPGATATSSNAAAPASAPITVALANQTASTITMVFTNPGNSPGCVKVKVTYTNSSGEKRVAAEGTFGPIPPGTSSQRLNPGFGGSDFRIQYSPCP